MLLFDSYDIACVCAQPSDFSTFAENDTPGNGNRTVVAAIEFDSNLPDANGYTVYGPCLLYTSPSPRDRG